METSRDKIRRMMMAINRIDEVYYSALRTLGMKDNMFILFYAISDGKPYSQKRICKDWSVPRTTLNTIVQECIKKDLITLVSQGHKEKEILLTEKGKLFSDNLLMPIFHAEETAIKPFLEKSLLEELECFTNHLESAFEQMTLNKR